MQNPNFPLVLFLGRKNGNFIDNVKYAFLNAVQNKYNFTPLFGGQKPKECAKLTKANLPAVYLNPQQAPVLPAKPALLVCDDYWWKNNSLLFNYLQDVPVLQLWHGIPLKKIGFSEALSSTNMNNNKAKHLRHLYSGNDWVISSSSFISQEIFPQVFSKTKYIITGYPRNDALLKPLHNKLELINADPSVYGQLRAHKRKGGKIVAFMPTFRDQGGSSLEHGKLELAALQSFAQQHNLLLVFKFHPNEPTKINPLAQNLPNLIQASAETDFYPCLSLADILITDYSSVYFDWLLLDRPVLFHVPDLEQYQTQNREFLLNFNDWTPGQKSFNQEELMQNIEACLNNLQNDPNICNTNGSTDNLKYYAKERQRMCDILFQFKDAHSSCRVCEYIENLVFN